MLAKEQNLSDVQRSGWDEAAQKSADLKQRLQLLLASARASVVPPPSRSSGLLSLQFENGPEGRIEQNELKIVDKEEESSSKIPLDLTDLHTALEAWAGKLPLSRILADAMPRKNDGHPLQTISNMTEQEVEEVAAAFSIDLKRILNEHIVRLRAAFAAMKEHAKNNPTSMKEKFEVSKLACGTITDFHKGLEGRIGYAHLNFQIAMEAEHCLRSGSQTPFTTRHYQITTCPEREWKLVVQRTVTPLAEEERRHNRCIPDLEELKTKEDVRKANLITAEIIATVLYTGPMFHVYNTILRTYPKELFTEFQQSGNLFPTTIFVLVSAVQKISRVKKLPDGLVLYRGLGGAVELPNSFWECCKVTGCSGFTEWGFMSTTSELQVALDYSGIRQQKPVPTVLVIKVGAVDRGACIKDFSQYPSEIEYLWVPCSFLEKDGPKYFEVTPCGVVEMYPVKVNANLKTTTTEELVMNKKQMHLSAFRYLINEIALDLEKRAKDGGDERIANDSTRDQGKNKNPAVDYTLNGFLNKIVAQCQEVYYKHDQAEPGDYTDNGKYRRFILEMVDVKVMALSKLDEWLENKTSSFIAYRWDAALRTVHRRWIAYLQKQLDDARTEKTLRDASLRLCKVEGIVVDGVTEVNELGETRLMSAAAEGRAADVALLISAGAEVNQCRHDGVTPVWLAAQFGHTDCIQALADMKAKVNQCSENGAAPIYIAAQSGNVDSIKKLAFLKADINAADVKALTPLHQAAMNGHLICMRELHNLESQMTTFSTEKQTPLDLASKTTNVQCADFLSTCVQLPSDKKKLIISTGDISDFDQFLAVREYSKTNADLLFIMNYPAYLGVNEVDLSFETKNPGLGFKYTAKEVFQSEMTTKEVHPKYQEFLSVYPSDDNQRMKGALTDLAFWMANQIWKESKSPGRLFFCIGGINTVNPFSATAIKNEPLVYSQLVPRPSKCLQTSEGTFYRSDGSVLEDLPWPEYYEIYMDFIGSMAFWNDDWEGILRNVVGKIKSVFIMGGVHDDARPVTVPAIPGVLNRFSGATMNQLYHPGNTGKFFKFLELHKIPAFTVSNNVVDDLETWDRLQAFMEANDLHGVVLHELASLYYKSQFHPPKKAYDYYAAFALTTKMTGACTVNFEAKKKLLFYSHENGITYVSSSNTWEGTRLSYEKNIDTCEDASDDDKKKNVKHYFRKEIELLRKIDVLDSVSVYDLTFKLDPNSRKLSLDQ